MTDEEPKTDAEKVRWLWKARDQDHQRIEDLRTTASVLREENLRFREEGRVLRAENAELRSQIAALGIEVNEARTAAMSAVENYRASVGDG